MNLCVSDEQVIINIQGIRNVTWGECSFINSSNPGRPWYITVTYKGSHNVFYYRSEIEAKSIFEKIRKAMNKLQIAKKADFLHCNQCGKCVSTAFIAIPTDTPDRGIIIRASITCPECIEKNHE